MNEQFLETRKRTLRIILVLSIIGSGLSCLSHLMMGAMLPAMRTMFYSGAFPYPQEVTVMMEQMFETPRPYYLCCALLYAMSVTGAVFMWNLRKSGFHLYTLAQLLVMLVTLLFLGKERLPLGDIMLTLLFITYYYIALRALGVLAPLKMVKSENSETTENMENQNNQSDQNSPDNSSESES